MFIWDTRCYNKRLCSKCYCNYNDTHYHPIGAFRNVYKDCTIKKRNYNEVSLLNTEMPNKFTGCEFYTEEMVITIETNSDDVKFWDMRCMLDNEIEYLFGNDVKINKRILNKFEQKNYIAGINQYTYLYTNYELLKERNKLSSKYNSSNNMLFNGFVMLKGNNNRNDSTSAHTHTNSNNSGVRSNNRNNTIDKYMEGTIKYFSGFDYEKTKNFEKEVSLGSNSGNSGNSSNSVNCYKEEEQYYKDKINEIKQKRNKKGATCLHVNRSKRKILVNTMASVQYVYDALYMDIKQPIELKGHESTYYTKSAISPCGNYVVSGSNKPVVHIWNLNKMEKSFELNGFHTNAVTCVDWSRHYRDFIASGCDNGMICIWSNNA